MRWGDWHCDAKSNLFVCCLGGSVVRCWQGVRWSPLTLWYLCLLLLPYFSLLLLPYFSLLLLPYFSLVISLTLALAPLQEARKAAEAAAARRAAAESELTRLEELHEQAVAAARTKADEFDRIRGELVGGNCGHFR